MAILIGVTIKVPKLKISHNDQVIRGAIQALGKAQSGTFDEDLSHYLAEIVLSDEQPDNVRICAYEAIESINDPPSSFLDTTKIPEALEKIKARVRAIQNRLMNDIDWQMVKSKIKHQS